MHQLRSIQKALAAIEARLTEPLRIDALARQAGMSLWHFQRTFSAMVGEPVGSYLRRRRLTEAARRLRTERRTILDVALEFQFESHEAFTRAFKAELRLTPSAWRAAPTPPAAGFPPVQLTLRSLQQRYRHMHLEPEIVTLPARSFCGLQAAFISAVSPDADNLAVIPKLWADFGPRRRELAPVEPGVSFGLCECTEAFGEQPAHPDQVLYLAAMEVHPAAPVPRGMKRWQSQAGTFAKFIHRGRVQGIGATMGFIYGKWLPTGAYDRVPGPDLERYDARFDPMSDESVLEIFVPVQARKPGAPREAKGPVRRTAAVGGG